MKLSSTLLVLLLATAGCSKKEKASSEAPAAPAAAAPARAAKAAAEDGAYDPNAAANVPGATGGKTGAAAEGGGKNWDSVVAEIVALRRPPMTDDKRSKMLALQDELSDAAKTDAAAREAYQNLARIINGR